MFVISCPDYKSPAFSNGDSKEWDRRIKQVTTTVETHNIQEGHKDLFYDLLSQGRASTYIEERKDNIVRVLESEGYAVAWKEQ